MANLISTAIAEARAKRGMTASEVGRAMGMSPQAVYNWEKGKNEPATKNLLMLAELFRVDSPRFLRGEVVFLEGSAPALAPTEVTPLPPSDVEPSPEAPAFRNLGGPRNVPELGIAVGGEDGDFDINGETIDYVPRPAALANRDVFAVRVKNHSMEPRFREGHLLYVERKRQPGPGDDAVIELHPEEEDGAGRAFIKELVSRGMASVVVRQFNPIKEITYPRERVKALYRVVPNNELFGV